MKELHLCLFATIIISISGAAFAAKPTKITPNDEGDVGGAPYRNYTVECDDGATKVVTSWGDGKKWCVGQKSQENCVKKQIVAAKTVCKGG
jgi:hypothetical protein